MKKKELENYLIDKKYKYIKIKTNTKNSKQVKIIEVYPKERTPWGLGTVLFETARYYRGREEKQNVKMAFKQIEIYKENK